MPAEPTGSDRLREIEVVDVAVGGDVHRVVLGGVLPVPGASVHDQMRHLETKADGLRRLLINEPYGAQHMCVDLLVPAKRADCSLGFVIMEVMGYPVYSGSNSLATGAAVVEAGLVPAPEDERPDADGVTRRPVRLEAPGGPVDLTADLVDGRVHRMRTGGDDAFAVALDRQVKVPGLGTVGYDLMYTGGFYVLVDAQALGLELTWANEPAINDAAFRIMQAVRDGFTDVHPTLGDLGPPPFLHFMGPSEMRADGTIEGRCAAYGHPKVIWRCPTGTGTSARLAQLAALHRRFLRGRRGQLRAVVVDRHLRAAALGLHRLVGAHVVQDREEVGPDVLDLAAVGAIVDRALDRLLHQIVGVGRIPHQRAGITPQRFQVDFDLFLYAWHQGISLPILCASPARRACLICLNTGQKVRVAPQKSKYFSRVRRDSHTTKPVTQMCQPETALVTGALFQGFT